MSASYAAGIAPRSTGHLKKYDDEWGTSMSQLDKWVGQRVRLKRTISAKVLMGKELVKTEPDEGGRRVPERVNLMSGETFTVIGHYSGKLDLLYKPVKISEKIILHVPPSALEVCVNDNSVR